jgi:hypothetical protein
MQSSTVLGAVASRAMDGITNGRWPFQRSLSWQAHLFALLRTRPSRRGHRVGGRLRLGALDKLRHLLPRSMARVLPKPVRLSDCRKREVGLGR